MTARRASRAGRYWVAFWLGLFLIVAMVVVARQQAALEVAGRLGQLRTKRGELEARHAELTSRIFTAKSKEMLGPKVARMGFTAPAVSQYFILSVDRDSAGRSR